MLELAEYYPKKSISVISSRILAGESIGFTIRSCSMKDKAEFSSLHHKVKTQH